VRFLLAVLECLLFFLFGNNKLDEEIGAKVLTILCFHLSTQAANLIDRSTAPGYDHTIRLHRE